MLGYPLLILYKGEKKDSYGLWLNYKNWQLTFLLN